MRFRVGVLGWSPDGATGDGVWDTSPAGNGATLDKINKGTVGHPPQPGDVISFDSPGLGHVAVVATSNVDTSGNGSITLLSQNDTANGWRTLAVSHWTVASFGDQIPYGWLHDPAGRGNPRARTTGSGYWML